MRSCVCVCARMRVCARACVCVRVRVCVYVCARVRAAGFSCVQHFSTPWTGAHQAPLFMGFSRQDYWSGLPCPPPGGLPSPGIEPVSSESPALQTDSLPPPGKPPTEVAESNKSLKPRADGKPQTSPGPHAFVPALTLSSPSPSTLTARTPLVLPPEQGSPHPGVTGRWQEPPPPWPQLPVTLEHPLQGAPGHPASQTRGLRVSLLPLRCARARTHSHTPTKPRCFSL